MARLSVRLRLGAVALGVCALLFAAFPLVRPFFRLDVFSPTLAALASGPLASPSWVIAHLLLAWIIHERSLCQADGLKWTVAARCGVDE